jgi:tetratricopeptide (TPR) repeat protein
MWWLAAVALASPEARVQWKGDAATLSAVAPAGQHVNRDAPADIDVTVGLRTLALRGYGSDLEEGLPLPAIRGQQVSASLHFQVCDDGGTTCKDVVIEAAIAVPDERKGTASMIVVDPEPHEEGLVAAWGGGDSAAMAEAALARASAEGKHVLLDFGAAWCPPCDLLGAEVLHAEDPPAVLDRYVVAQLDVDDPSSFPHKARYAVGSYPTLVVVDAAGTELGRLVGYDGPAETTSWLEAVLGPDSDDAIIALGPADADGAVAGRIARKLLRERRGEPAAWLAIADFDTVDARIARLWHEATVDDAMWLAANAPGTAADWADDALSLEDEAVTHATLAAIDRDLASADPSKVADLLWIAAGVDDDQTLYAAAGTAVRASLSGDPERDRGQYTWLAVIHERAGAVDVGLALLADASARWPDEPTFHLSAVSILRRAGRYEEALVEARAALASSWGDNRLRAAKQVASTLFDLDRPDEAREVAKQALEEAAEVADDLAVRTHSYRAALRELIEQ